MAPEMAAVERTGGYDLKVRNFESFNVSGKLPTYPSPKLTLTLTSHLGQNVGLIRGGLDGQFPGNVMNWK